MDWKRFFKALFFIFVLAFGFAQPAFGQTGTVVRVSPDYQEVDPGETFSVAIEIDNVTDLYGFDVAISYDPAAIALDRVEYGDFLEIGIGLLADEAPGTARCILSQTSPQEPKSGSGTLCIFYFVAGDSDGESDLTFNLIELSDRDGKILTTETANGFVQIGEPKSGSEVYIPLFLAGGGK